MKNIKSKMALKSLSVCYFLALSITWGCSSESVSLTESKKQIDVNTSSLTSIDSMKAFEANKQKKQDDGTTVTTNHYGAHGDLGTVESENVKSDIWSLELKSYKSTFLLGEPIAIDVSLKNSSNTAQKTSAQLEPEYQHVTYRVITPSGKQTVYKPIAEYCVMAMMQEKSLAPKDVINEEINLFASRGGWLFPEAGTYIITAEMEGEKSTSVTSNSMKINVVKGSSHDAFAGKLFMTGETPLLLSWQQGDHLKNANQALLDTISKYPETIHATYAKYALGLKEAQSFFNGKTRRPANPKLALVYLEDVRNSLKQNPKSWSPEMTWRTYDYLAKSYVGVGNAKAAFDIKNEFENVYSSMPEFAKYSNLD